MVLSLQVAPALLQPHSSDQGNYLCLIRDVLKAAEFGTEAEATDAELE